MSDMMNPYQSPHADTKIERPLLPQGALTEIMIAHLKGASPWLRFMGIMGFIGAGFMILAGLIFLVLVPVTSDLVSEIDVDGFFGFFDYAGPFMFIYTVYFIAAGIVMFFPALFTYKFGEKIRSYLVTNSEAELELAFKNNKSLWKFNGILTIIGLAIVPVITVISIVIAVAALAIGQ